MWVHTLYVCLGSVQGAFYESEMPEGLSTCVILAGNSMLDLSSLIHEDKSESAKRAGIESEVNRKRNELERVALWGRYSFNGDGCLCIQIAFSCTQKCLAWYGERDGAIHVLHIRGKTRA